MKKIYYQQNQDFEIVGTPKEQQGFALYFKAFMQDAFIPRPIGLLSTNKKPFFAYVEDSKSVTIDVEGTLIELSPMQQGVIGTYRYAIFMKNNQMLDSLDKGVNSILTDSQINFLLPKAKNLLFDFRTFARKQRIEY
ncbi:hypothetical protein JQC92_00865 [Shewanella sp. 202IG2-18]|uniref:hypothetical protein n=1 Tax=Parashewanella hymeniacidonis TaxID=2807618 RepID=UPI00195F6136|nr:hypothetical protein [Parashewanella hymeniacidonis]MBM7070596.1 hypothetical protein [Parashewanella hymeniacidonis]